MQRGDEAKEDAVNCNQMGKHRPDWVRAVLVGMAAAIGPLLVGACAETDHRPNAVVDPALIPEDIQVEEKPLPKRRGVPRAV